MKWNMYANAWKAIAIGLVWGLLDVLVFSFTNIGDPVVGETLVLFSLLIWVLLEFNDIHRYFDEKDKDEQNESVQTP